MVYGFASRSKDKPTWYELQHAILRNFGGLDDVKPIDVFMKHLRNINQNQPVWKQDKISLALQILCITI